MKKSLFLLVLIGFLQISNVQGRTNNLVVHNDTEDKLVIYLKYSKWIKVAKVLGDIISLSSKSPSVSSSSPVGNGILMTILPGEKIESGVTNAIHKIYINIKTYIKKKKRGEDKFNIKEFKNKALYFAEYFKIEGEKNLKNKISVINSNTTDLYIEKKGNKYNVWATKPRK